MEHVVSFHSDYIFKIISVTVVESKIKLRIILDHSD